MNPIAPGISQAIRRMFTRTSPLAREVHRLPGESLPDAFARRLNVQPDRPRREIKPPQYVENRADRRARYAAAGLDTRSTAKRARDQRAAAQWIERGVRRARRDSLTPKEQAA